MNRIIKFRVWDKDNKQMHLDYPLTGKGGFSSLNHVFDLFKVNNCVLMQYTGLHDKNGKEIWEGDIVNRNTGYPPRIVTWMPEGRYTGWFASRPDNQQTGNIIDHLPLDIDGKEIEVIGNIYENPDLISKEETKR